MGGSYLKCVSECIEDYLHAIKNAKDMLECFKNDLAYVDGLNGKDPSMIIHNAMVAIDESKNRMMMFNDFIKEALDEQGN